MVLACSLFSRNFLQGGLATLALMGSLGSEEEALMNQSAWRKLRVSVPGSLTRNHYVPGSQHSSLFWASFLDFSKKVLASSLILNFVLAQGFTLEVTIFMKNCLAS
jgi:hypothetical protein